MSDLFNLEGNTAIVTGGSRGLGREMATALAEAGADVTVNCICPGPFATEINGAVMEDAEATASLLENVPMKRWGQMEEIRAAVVFLACRAASYVTGAIVTVDGGWTAR